MDTSGNRNALVADRDTGRHSRRTASSVAAAPATPAPRPEAAARPAVPSVGDLSEALRQAIVAGRLAPGARLTEAGLNAEYGAGGLVLHDALTVLESRGLVVREPRRFWRVRAHDEQAIRQLYAVRGLLERHAVAGLDAAQADIGRLVQDLSAANAVMEKKRAARDAEGYLKANERFHALMLRHAPNEPLRLAIELLNDMAAPLRLARLARDIAASTAVEEHAAIIEMLDAGQMEAAVDAMHDHILGNADAAVAAAT
jgi:DNA-binding GntR family transcriptional regulator